MGKALEYINNLGLDNISRWEEQLRAHAEEQLGKISGLKIFGNAREKIATFSMLLGEIHQLDTGMVLDKMGIAVRTGTHCTQPVMNHYNIEGTVRASMAMYNTTEEIDKLAEALQKVNQMFG
jgi:cysteine desulfurase/selenocysteine lyase